MVHTKVDIDKFVKLLEDKKLKEARTYIKKIEQQNNDAENIVAKALEQCLVAKKTTPMGVTVALFIYKELLMRSLFDYTQSEIFSEDIHQFIYQICQYNKTAKEDRGKNYFKDTLKTAQNQQNEELGNTAIILALEIVQMMAEWYPIDYLTQEESRYVLYMKQLKNKKVQFPDPDENTYLKPQDKAAFDVVHKKWLKKMDELYNQEEEQGTPQGNIKTQITPAIVPPLKTNVPSKLQQNAEKQIKKDEFVKIPDTAQSKIKSTLNDNKTQNKDKSKIEVKPEIGKVGESAAKFVLDDPNAKIKSYDFKQTTIQKGSQPPKVIQEKFKAVIVTPNKNTITEQKPKIKQSPQKKNQQTNNPPIKKNQVKQGASKIAQTQKNSLPIKQIKKEETQSKIVQQKKQQIKKQIQKTSNNQTSQLKPQSRPQSRAGSVAESIVTPIKTDRLNQMQNKSPEQSLSNSRIQKVTEEPFQPPPYSQSPNVKYTKEAIKKEAIRNENQKYQLADELIRKSQVRLNEPKYEYTQSPKKDEYLQIPKNQQYPRVARKTQQNFYSRNQPDYTPKRQSKQEANRKLFKTQKPFQRPEENKKATKKSMPKTEKKLNFGNDNFLGLKFANLSPDQKRNIISGNQGQTLSDFRQLKNKKKNLYPQGNEFAANQPLLSIIERTKLGERLIPFLPQYYQPVDLGMRALILESLRVGSNPTLEPSKPFFKNSQISIRLLKSGTSYIVSLNNISASVMDVGYCQALQAKYGDQFNCQIRVKGMERKKPEEVLSWKVDPHNFVDIIFDFYTADPNFKFLLFAIAINNEILTMNLPITLLDQGIIDNYIDIEEIAEFIDLYGRILKSPPLNVPTNENQREIELPMFFGRQKNTRLLGQMSYSIETEPNNFAKVSFFLKKMSDNPSKYQIHAIYDNRNEANEDYAKVLLQLLCFLMYKYI